MTSFCKTLKTLPLNRPLSRMLLRGDNALIWVLGGGESGASRPIPLLPHQPVDWVISTKTHCEAVCCREKSVPQCPRKGGISLCSTSPHYAQKFWVNSRKDQIYYQCLWLS